MARLWGTGFEHGSQEVFDLINGTPLISAVAPRNGTYCWEVDSQYEHGYKGLPARGELFARIGIWPNSDQYLYATYLSFIRLETADDHILFGLDSTSRRIEVRKNTQAGDLIVAGATVIPSESWTCIEIRAIPDAAAGVVQVLVNGVSEIDFAGSTADAGTEFIGIRVGHLSSSNFYGMLGYYDDIAINDTTGVRNNSWCGRGGFWPVIPNGVGTASDFTPLAGANWTNVDDIPPDDDTSYVESDTVDDEDLYQVAALTPTTGTINAVHYWTRAKMEEPGDGGLRRLIRHDGANYEGTDLVFDTSYGYPFTVTGNIMEQAPDATDWSVAKVNALEIGQKVV